MRSLVVSCLFGALLCAQAPPAGAKKQAPAAKPPVEGQEPEAPNQLLQQEIPIFKGGITEVVAPVTVTNNNGDFVLNLKPEDFRLFDNEVRQQIKVELTEMPLSVVILVGNSSKVEPLLNKVRKLGNVFTNLVLGETGEAAIITFDHRVEVVQGFTNDAEKLEKVFKDLPVGSEQARLSDAMVQALTLLSQRPKERRKAIIVVAEARDWGSETDIGYVMRQAQLGGISIYSVGLSGMRANLTRNPPPPPRSPFPPGATPGRPGIPNTGATQVHSGSILAVLVEAVRGVKNVLFDNPLEAYAEATGAVHLGKITDRGVEDAVGKIARELRSQYMVTYRPNTLNQVGFHTIKVMVDRPGTKARTRPGYYFSGPAMQENPPAEM